MEITGTGYRAAVQGKDLVLNLGFSHEVRYPIPEGIKITCERPTAVKRRGRGQAAGRPGRRGDPRLSGRPSPTRARACGTTDEQILRKEGKKK